MIRLYTILKEDLFKTSLALKPYEKLIINAVIEFMKSKFKFNSKIIVKKKSHSNLLGDITLNDNSLIKDKFYLHYNDNQSYAFIIKTLLHELTHVKQISNGELKPTPDYKSLMWKGKEIITVKDYKKMGKKDIANYKNLPWEKEAYMNMGKLYTPFIQSDYWKSLYGKDTNLDYIIDNI